MLRGSFFAVRNFSTGSIPGMLIMTVQRRTTHGGPYALTKHLSAGGCMPVDMMCSISNSVSRVAMMAVKGVPAEHRAQSGNRVFIRRAAGARGR
jgi:hypothetical protein